MYDIFQVASYMNVIVRAKTQAENDVVSVERIREYTKIPSEVSLSLYYRPVSQTVFMLSIAINRAEHVCATVIIKHNYMLMCNHKIVINIMLCLLNSTGHI